MKLDTAITLAGLSLSFGLITRATAHMLSLVVLEQASAEGLDVGLCCALVQVHDLPELYAGDTDTAFGLTDEQRLDKHAREQAALERLRVELAGTRTLELLELYERLVEEHTEEPTFYLDFPASVSPLTRPHRSTRGLAERWDLVAWGVELGTAYSELTDPVEQRRRLQEQSLLAAGGDPEAMELDEDFLQAMEYAMPPTGGLGVGVDRVVMLITGHSIRETLPFPLAKPR